MRFYNVEGTKNHEPIKNNKTKLNKKQCLPYISKNYGYIIVSIYMLILTS